MVFFILLIFSSSSPVPLLCPLILQLPSLSLLPANTGGFFPVAALSHSYVMLKKIPGAHPHSPPLSVTLSEAAQWCWPAVGPASLQALGTITSSAEHPAAANFV